jgi:hypothetical protein
MSTVDVTALTVLPPEVDKAYQHYVESHFGDLSDPQGLALTMWNAGGRHAVEAMSVFGDVLPRLSHMELRIQAMRALLIDLFPNGENT